MVTTRRLSSNRKLTVPAFGRWLLPLPKGGLSAGLISTVNGYGCDMVRRSQVVVEPSAHLGLFGESATDDFLPCDRLGVLHFPSRGELLSKLNDGLR